MLPSQINAVPPSSLQSALQMDPNQHLQQLHQQQPPQQPPQQQPGGPTPKRRKRGEGNDEDGPSGSEPRRLRRSHEACARCRSKKIKCDSKHPRCTACATAGTACNQEDRHRRTLTPRGYTERLEQQLSQCEALLKRHIPGFTFDALDDILAREGIDIGGIAHVSPNPNFQIDPARDGPSQSQPPTPKPSYPPMYPPGPHIMHPPYGMVTYGMPGYHPQMIQGPPGPYNMHPHFPPGPYPPPPGAVMHPPPPEQQPPPPPPPQQQPPLASPIMRTMGTSKGIDPNGHDMSSAQALAKNFGVSSVITSGLKLNDGNDELPVDPNALPKIEIHGPRDANHWISVSTRRNPPSGVPNTLSLYGPTSKSPQVDIWLPKDLNFALRIVDVYFRNLNIHRPVYSRKEFDRILKDLYEGNTAFYEPGHVCSIYFILALGTLSELNDRASAKSQKRDQYLGSAIAKEVMPADWPVHDEFFERALAVKPDLRVSISSLQALILLHWYLYIERQGRTLWRLVGNLVRLSIELGLHHDPTTQVTPDTNQHIFTEEESQLRIRLWAIVLVHDRGTSILLGRPLAIAPSDSNTPHPSRSNNKRFAEFSEHFELSHPVAEIQADIINSLYAPTRQAGDTIMRNATRIIKSMAEFRRNLPEKYQYYFGGTEDWSLDKKRSLVEDISEDEGLTLLKIGIARILMLRALFSSKELSYEQKHKALNDAIITSHNIIIVHSQLIRFPNIAFFTSPIPLHIAAMVILYGHISKVDCLPSSVALEDVWLALDIIPRIRWRWERKDANGGHPLIAKLVEHVMGVNLHTVVPKNTSVLICELDWDESLSPTSRSQLSTPLLSPPGAYTPNNANQTSGTTSFGQHQRGHNNGMLAGGISRSGGGTTPPDKRLVEMPDKLFYPFFPEAQIGAIPPPPTTPSSSVGGAASSGSATDYSQLLKSVAAAQGGYGPYVEERESTSADGQQEMVWGGVNVPNSRNIPNYTP